MKKIICVLLVFLFLPACSVQLTYPNREKDVAEGKDDFTQDEIPHEELKTTKWSIEYNSDAFFVQRQTDDSAVFALLEDVCQNENDASIYLSISFRRGISAKESADKAVKTEEEAGADTAIDTSMINEMEIPHVHIAWGEAERSTIYDIYYFDTDGGCFALTLCYYIASSEIWEKEMMDMVNSFSLESNVAQTGFNISVLIGYGKFIEN